jgi:ketosteroid isomerase-like protein
VEALDRILAADLLFTNHMGQVVSKAQDLELHRSGTLRLRSVETVELKVLGNATLPMTSICVKLGGTYGGQSFDALLRYTRVWRQADDGQWQLVVAHSSPVL